MTHQPGVYVPLRALFLVLLYVRFKSGVTFVWRCFRDVKSQHGCILVIVLQCQTW